MFYEIITSLGYKHSGMILRVPETKTAAIDVTFLLTGNNLALVINKTRRTLMIRIDPRCEIKEYCTGFVILDLPKYIMEHPDGSFRIALNIKKSFIIARRPQQDIPNRRGLEVWPE